VLLEAEQLDRLRLGVALADGPTRPAIVKHIRDGAKYTFFEITITEGRNRQVRRMVEALGAKVLKLVRTGIGGIEIGALEIGKYRELEKDEVYALSGTPRNPSGRSGAPARLAEEASRRNGRSARAGGETRRPARSD
jgi:16S rRNA U516 pseudouridylate synthase RsuA-like enzyme